MTTEQNIDIPQQNVPRNYTSEEKMMVIQLAAALYTPDQIQTLWKESTDRYLEMGRLASVISNAHSDKAKTPIISAREALTKTMQAAKSQQEKLQKEEDNYKRDHHLLVKLRYFEFEVKVPYKPN